MAVRLRRVAGPEAHKLESTSRLVVLANLGEPHSEEMKCGENKTFLEHSCDIVVRFLFFVFFPMRPELYIYCIIEGKEKLQEKGLSYWKDRHCQDNVCYKAEMPWDL